jgi:hypothetical protein
LESFSLGCALSIPATFVNLTSAATLTALKIVDGLEDRTRSCLQYLAPLKLIQLQITDPLLYGHAFLAFASGPNAHRLQRLEIEHWFAAGFEQRKLEAIPTEDYVAAFRALSGLHTLHLRRTFGSDALLPHLVHASSLRQVTLELRHCSNWELWRLLPSASVLHALLSAAPILHVTLLLTHNYPGAGAAEPLMLQRCAALVSDLAEFGHRFAFRR